MIVLRWRPRSEEMKLWGWIKWDSNFGVFTTVTLEFHHFWIKVTKLELGKLPYIHLESKNVQGYLERIRSTWTGCLELERGKCFITIASMWGNTAKHFKRSSSLSIDSTCLWISKYTLSALSLHIYLVSESLNQLMEFWVSLSRISLFSLNFTLIFSDYY